jgi:flagellar hook-associated protein FlgK
MPINFNAGVSGIRTARYVMEMIGNNIANVNTPRYSRQEAVLSTLPETSVCAIPRIGQGVQLNSIEAIRDNLVETKLRNLEGDLAGLEMSHQLLTQIEELVNDTTEGGINALVARLFNNFELLAARPQDSSVRIQLVNDAQRLAARINETDQQLEELQRQLRPEIDNRVDKVNDLLKQIAAVNRKIQWMENTDNGASANEFIDESNRLLSELTQLVKIEVREDGNHVRKVTLNGEILVLGDQASTVSVSDTNPSMLEIKSDGHIARTMPTGGQLGALFQFQNATIPQIRDELDQFTRGLLRTSNGTHAEGIGLNGRYTSLISEIPVADTNGDGDLTNDILFDNDGLKIAPKAGFIHITVANANSEPETFQRYEIPIEPAKDTLGTLATKLSAIPGLTASADPDTGLLSLSAQSGYSFDFAKPTDLGHLVSSNPNSPSIELGGEFSGMGTDEYTFSITEAVPGSGQTTAQIGQGSVTVQVLNRNGELVKALQLGQGYIPGEELTLGNGLTVCFGQGTVHVGETLSTPIYSADTDTADLLPALGINTLFSGQGARDIAVSERILQDPRNIAHALSDDPGDVGNAIRLSNLFQNAIAIPEFEPGVTVAGTFQNFVQKIGQDSASAEHMEDVKRKATESISALRESISGVSVDEEIANLLRFQQMFQASARHISAMNEMTQILYNL